MTNRRLSGFGMTFLAFGVLLVAALAIAIAIVPVDGASEKPGFMSIAVEECSNAECATAVPMKEPRAVAT